MERRIQPSKFQVFRLDIRRLKSHLMRAAVEGMATSAAKPVQIEIPLANGELGVFQILESPIMARGLANRYSEIKTYSGILVSNPRVSLRCDVTPQGFHAIIFAEDEGVQFIDPLYYGQDAWYQVYAKKDFLPSAAKRFTCHTIDQHGTRAKKSGRHRPTLFGDSSLHTYRLALSCTGEYGLFHGGTKPLVMGAMVTTMNRINGVFLKEFAVRMILIDRNDTLIFSNPATDPFDNDDLGSMLDRNQVVTDSLVGNSAYDIGHIFGTSGGGLAHYASVCQSAYKAKTGTGLNPPVGDPFDVDYVSHEMGHQFSGSHPHRGCGNDNPAAISTIEPGSGSTIMAYGGICGDDDVQSNSDDYFCAFNMLEMGTFIVREGGQTCGVHTPRNNTPPVVVDTLQQFIIPKSTPFFLRASAFDPDGDSINYCWEQFDPELNAQPPVASGTKGPNFRSVAPGPNPVRYFPSLSTLANNGPYRWEVLPSVARILNFRITVRDVLSLGAGSDMGAARLRVTHEAGPFHVTNPNSNFIDWTSGGQAMVNWNPANTAFAPVNCSSVDIFLSTNGGQSYPILLAEGVPNVGAYPVDVPNLTTNTARIMVVGSGNVFFDVSNQNFRISAPEPGFLVHTFPKTITTCGVDTLRFQIKVDSTGGPLGLVALSLANVPPGMAGQFVQDTVLSGTETELVFTGMDTVQAGIFQIEVKGTGASGPRTATLIVNVAHPLPADPVSLVSPVNNAFHAQVMPMLAWQGLEGAESYSVQMAFNAGFSPLRLEQNGIPQNQYPVPEPLPIDTVVYWRVKARNSCGEGVFGPNFRFSTATPVCTTLTSGNLPQPISNVGEDTAVAVVNFPVSSTVIDVNVAELIGTHEYMRDLRFELWSPGGTKCGLMGPVCEGADDFNIRFDDESALFYEDIPCPCTDGEVYQPRTPLSVFKGKNPQGIWTLLAIDVQGDDGGSLTNASVEICYVPPVNEGCNFAATPVLTATNCTACATNIGFALSNATGKVAYLWSDGGREVNRINVCQGNYTVKLVDSASCEATVQISVPAVGNFLTVSTSATASMGGNNGTATATPVGGNGPFTFLWNTGDTTATISQLPTGTYSVTITDANGCTSTGQVFVPIQTRMKPALAAGSFSILPNPNSGRFKVILNDREAEEVWAEIYAPDGRRVYSLAQRPIENAISFDLKHQPSGLYFVFLQTKSGRWMKSVLISGSR